MSNIDKQRIAAIIADCFLCQQGRRCGPHVYEGRNVPSWDVWICNTCRSGNWDGIVINSNHGQRLVEHLKSKGIKIEPNAKGHLPIPNY
jgi:hypothetical protein